MKILFVLDRPNLYGSEQHVLRLISALQKDHDVFLLALAKGPMLEKVADLGVSFLVVKTGWFSFGQVPKLFKFIRNGNFQVVHAHQPKAMFWSSIICKLARLPCVVTVHSLPENNAQSYSNWLVKFAVGTFHHLVKWVSELLAYQVVYLSKFSYAKALSKSKSQIIPNWIDKVIDDERTNKEFCLPIRLVSVGSLTFNKGMDRLIESLALIKDHNWEIKIVGDSSGDYGHQLKEQARSLNILDRVEFTGYIEDINPILLQSDGFIMLSRGETFGLVYIEAMNCGLPVIAWDIPVVKEILPAGNLVMRENNDIRKIFTDIYSTQANFKRLATTNKEFVKSHFSFDKVFIRYLNLYDQVLSRSNN